MAAWLDRSHAPQLDACVVATRQGLSVLHFYETSLADKATHYETIAASRHTRAPGLVAGSSLESFGDVFTSHQGSDDNDGLWTSVYLASQCFRYALTKDPAVKQSAWAVFEGLEFLNQATGIPGLPARRQAAIVCHSL